jgi:Holliday junction resolvase RusA-like endonuclease
MDQVKEIYIMKEGKASLREYVIPATNKHRFEVKNRGKTLYEGESYQQARSLFQGLIEKTKKPAGLPVDVISPRPKRRIVRLRTAHAEAL